MNSSIILADTELEAPLFQHQSDKGKQGHRILLRELPTNLSNRYQIVKELPNQGKEADLFLVASREDASQRVVKLYRGNRAPKENVLQAVRDSQSEHLLKIYEFGSSDGYFYELLEFIKLGNLRDFLLKGNLAKDQYTSLLKQLAEAISDLHALNIFHRDIKPDNILIKTFAPIELVLSDYGIASETDGTTWETEWAGTAIYMAPEIAAGSTQLVTSACDYWALGMVMTEILSGAHPFKDLSRTLVYSQLATKPIDVSRVPSEWRRLCRGLLIRDPKNRWGKEQVLRWLAGERETIPIIEDSAATGQVYSFSGKEHDNLLALLADFSRIDNWNKGCAEIRQGHLTDWLRKTSQYEAATYVEELRGLKPPSNDDLILLLLVAHFCPKLPLIWKGQAIDLNTLLALAVRQDESALVFLTNVFDSQLLTHPRLENRNQIQQLGLAWMNAVRDNEALWASESIHALGTSHRGDRRIEVSNALLAVGDPKTRSNLLSEAQRIANATTASRCAWFVQQVNLASSQHGKLHTLVRLGDQAAIQGEAVIAEEVRQAKVEQDARLWSERRRKIVMKASIFGLSLGSIMGTIRYWMVSLDSFYWMPWDFSKGMDKILVWQPLLLSLIYIFVFGVAIGLFFCIYLYFLSLNEE